MRAVTFLATTIVSAAALLGGAAVTPGPTGAHAQDAAAPPPVPGPQRPIAETPPPDPIPATADKRRARPTPPVVDPPPRAVAPPAVPPPLPATTVLEGGFRPGAPGEKAEGRAIARRATSDLRLEKLAVTAGRDLELWLVAADRLGHGEDLSETKHVSLGRLKKAEGDQTYRLPPEIDLRVYRAVVVWSRRERAARAYAPLAPQAVQRTVKQKKSGRG